jgi:hypothetical protein
VNSPRTPAIEHGTLALGKVLGQGGQGTVHEVTNRKINEAAGGGWDVVYKEYSPAVLPSLRADALTSRADLVGQLSAADATWLCERTAWPAAVVRRQGQACGFLMRAVPERFRFVLRALDGTTGIQRLATMEYLLNDDAYVAGIGLTISSRDRLALLCDLATTLSRLHRLGITVGDLSPKNLLFTTSPHPECFLIDADAMRLRGNSVLPQAETPDWQVPAGEEKATGAGDVYKLALLAIRLVARDQTAIDPAVLAPVSPELADLARCSLDPDRKRRPTPAAWAEHLAAAGTTASTAPAAASVTAPAGPGGRVVTGPGPRVRRAAGGPAAAAGGVPGGNPARAKAAAGFAASVVALIALVAFAAAHSGGHGSGSAASAYSTASDTASTDPVYTDPDTTEPDPTEPDPTDPDPTEPESTEPDTPSDSPSADAVASADIGSCFHDNGTSGHADLVATDCTDGAFKVVRVQSGTTDLSSCDDVTDSDESVASSSDDRVLCLSYLSPGGTAYHARQGDCVFGSGGPWSTQSCQTGNFKVLATYRGTTDHAKCNSWPHYNEWKTFTVGGDSGLDVLLCLSMNYPDDAGYATQYECLLKSGSDTHATFTNTGSCASSNVVVTGRTSRYGDRAFCRNDGWTTWRSSAYPSLAYTVCWRPK